MKRFLILLFFFATSMGASFSQTESYWPDSIHYIPGHDVELFNLDKSHSKLVFSVGFFGFSDVEGSFDRYSATILYNEADLTKTSVFLVIDANSINTGSTFRDKDLKKENFFDTENHKVLTFVSQHIEVRGGQFIAIGDLTIKGVPKKLSYPLPVFRNVSKTPFGVI